VSLHSLLGVRRADGEGGVDIGVVDLVSIVYHHPQNASGGVMDWIWTTMEFYTVHYMHMYSTYMYAANHFHSTLILITLYSFFHCILQDYRYCMSTNTCTSISFPIHAIIHGI